MGLIRRLPHHLVEAFKSTLEEASNADLILHVCDASNENVEEQAKVTEELLAELGCGEIPILRVFNKCDCITELPRQDDSEDHVFISAKTGFGFDALLRKIAQKLPNRAKRMHLLLPYDKGGILSRIRENGSVYTEEYTDAGIAADCMVSPELFSLTKDYMQ